MKKLNQLIMEKLKISSKSKFYSCQPKTREELRKILEERLAEDKNADLNDIDVSKITNMGMRGEIGLFEKLDPHNIDVSDWDVSNVNNMAGMFYECENFTGKGLENWDVSNVIKMYFMFYDCTNFNCDLSKWDVSKTEDMYRMFDDCKKFTGEGLENWDVSNAKDIRYMFDGCNSLKNKPSWYHG